VELRRPAPMDSYRKGKKLGNEERGLSILREKGPPRKEKARYLRSEKGDINNKNGRGFRAGRRAS